MAEKHYQFHLTAEETGVLALLKHLFGRFVAHRGWDTQEMEKADYFGFYFWLLLHWPGWFGTELLDWIRAGEGEDTEPVPLAAMGISPESFLLCQRLLSQPPKALAQLRRWWPAFVLGSRPPPTCRARALQISVLLVYPPREGSEAPIAVQLQEHLEIREEDVLTDGLACTWLAGAAEKLNRVLAAASLQGLWEDALARGAPPDELGTDLEKG